ncbi:MAG: tetratricopeptide repeat protein [Planctomycetota bacterium]
MLARSTSLVFLAASCWCLIDVSRCAAGFAQRGDAGLCIALALAAVGGAIIAPRLPARLRAHAALGTCVVNLLAFAAVSCLVSTGGVVAARDPSAAGGTSLAPALILFAALAVFYTVPAALSLHAFLAARERERLAALFGAALIPFVLHRFVLPELSPATVMLIALFATAALTWARSPALIAEVAHHTPKWRTAGLPLLATALGAALAMLQLVCRQHVPPCGPSAGTAVTAIALGAATGFAAARLIAGERPLALALLPLALAGLGMHWFPRWASSLALPRGREAFEAALGHLATWPALVEWYTSIALVAWLALLGGLALGWLARPAAPWRRPLLTALPVAGLSLGYASAQLLWAASAPLENTFAVLAFAIPGLGALTLLMSSEATRLSRALAILAIAALGALFLIPPSHPLQTTFVRVDSLRAIARPETPLTSEGFLVLESLFTVTEPMESYRLDRTVLVAEPSSPSLEADEVSRALAGWRDPAEILVVDGYATDHHLAAWRARATECVVWPIIPDLPPEAALPWSRSSEIVPAESLPPCSAARAPRDRRWFVFTPPLSPSTPLFWGRFTLEALQELRREMPPGSACALVLDPGMYPAAALLAMLRTFGQAFPHAALLFLPDTFESVRLLLLSDPSPPAHPWSAIDPHVLFDGLLALDESLEELTRGARIHRVLDPALRYTCAPILERDPMVRLRAALDTLGERLASIEPAENLLPDLTDSLRADLSGRRRAALAVLESFRERCRSKPYSYFRVYRDEERIPIPLECVHVLLKGLETRPGDPMVEAITEQTLETLMNRGRYEVLEDALEPAIDTTLPWPGASYFLGRTYLEVLEPAVARPYLERAFTLHPAYRDAEALLGLALQETGDLESARAHLLAAWKRGAIGPRYLERVGSALVKLGEREAGIAALRKAIELDPHDEAAARRLRELEPPPGENQENH